MASWIITMIYIGGFENAYKHHRKVGDGKFMAAVGAIGWPVDIGIWLTSFYTSKKNKDE